MLRSDEQICTQKLSSSAGMKHELKNDAHGMCRWCLKCTSIYFALATKAVIFYFSLLCFPRLLHGRLLIDQFPFWWMLFYYKMKSHLFHHYRQWLSDAILPQLLPIAFHSEEFFIWFSDFLLSSSLSLSFRWAMKNCKDKKKKLPL